MHYLYLIAIFLLGFRGLEIYKVKISDLAFVVLALILAYRIYIKKDIELKYNKSVIFVLIGFIGAALLSMIKAFSYSEVLSEISRYCFIVLEFLIINIIISNDTKYLKYSINTYLMSCFISGLFSYYSWAAYMKGFKTGFLHNGELRVMPFYNDPNHYATFLLIGLFLIFIKFYTKNMPMKKKVLYGLFEAYLFGILILTGSRGAVLSYIFGINLIILAATYQSFKKWQWGLLIVVLLAVNAFLYKGGYYDMLLRFKWRRGTLSTGINYRANLWKGAVYAFLSSPIIGVGAHNFKLFYQHFYAKYGLVPQAANYTHNIYLGILSELGIIGFAVAGALVYVIMSKFVKLLKNSNEMKYIYILIFPVIICVIMAQGFTLDLFLSRAVWFIISLVTCHAFNNNSLKELFNEC